MTKIIVTGGREYDNEDLLLKVLTALQPTMIIEGGAEGADRLAQTYANHNNIKLDTVEANWKKHGNRAGIIRNGNMIAKHLDADFVLAFDGGVGTENCIKQARERGLIVLRVEE